MSGWRLWSIAIAMSVFSVPALGASQKDWSDCRGKDANRSIAGCTRVLQDKKETPRNRAEAYYNRALAYKANSELDRAIEDFTDAIRLDPTSAKAYAKRGDTWDDKGDRDIAIADLTEAIRLDPNYAWAYAIRGYIYDNKRQFDLAIADYSESLRIDPKDAGTVANRGWTRRKNGDLAGAFTDFNEAIRLDPKFVRAYYNRGLAWNDKNEFDRAIADFNEAIRLDPKNDIAYHDRALSKYYKGEFAGAASDLARSNELKPESFTALRLYIARGRAGANGEAELSKYAATLKTAEWPRVIIDFYLGKGSERDVMAAAGKTDERCDADFYLGEWHLLHDKRAEAAKALRAATADDCPKYLFEYVGAVIDLKRLAP